jgi:UDP-N-acetylmuramoyl-tripeptide--D-alanyl-D-alanine ligase
MRGWTVGQLLKAVQGTLVAGNGSEAVSGIGIDSRRLAPRQAFLAIQGPRFDGHTFLQEAIDRQASCLVVAQRPPAPPPVPTILVHDTTKALGALAAYHRRRFAIPVIAVTGSCGKTTTKDLIAHLLSGAEPVLKTRGTENNHIGLPLTLLRLAPSHRYAVVELGSNHPGEIAYLARLAQPTMAVVTNIGPAHLEFFESLDAVRHEKLSLLDSLDPHGAAIIPGDQLDVLLEAKSRLRPGTTLVTFGASDQCGVQVVETRRKADGLSLRLRGTPGEFFLPLLGFHNVENALAALACLKALGVPWESVRDRLREMPPPAMRSELIRCNGLTIINDCYNANPLSFARALELLGELETTRKVLIAGDMLELGGAASKAHHMIGELAARSGIDVLLAVGDFAETIAHGASERRPLTTEVYRTVEDLLSVLPSRIRSGDGILVKGSRRVRLERVTVCLQALGHSHG